MGLELAQALEVGRPAGADGLGDEVGQPRVREPDEPPRCDAVRHVRELARVELVEVGQHLLAQQLRVQLGDAVDLRARDGREVGHAHRAVGELADDRHVADAHLVVAVALAHLVEELLVDAVDDLEVARQQPAEQVDRPHLEGFGQQGVARVGEAFLGDRPRGIPVHLLLVDEHAHELGHADHRVRVVQLEDDAVGQGREVEVVGQLLEEVADGCRDEEVLLLQPQFLALRGGVFGVEHLGDVLGVGLGADGLFVVARVEHPQVERVGRLRAPEPQRVDAAVQVARHHVVVGHRLHVPARHPARALGALVVVGLGVAAERDAPRRLGVRELPGRSEGEPRVGLLDLLAVYERLAEDAVLVADAVADVRDAEGRKRVDEARREAPEAAVAEAGLDLLRAQSVDVDAARGHRVGRDLGEPRREQVVVELTAEQVLGGQVRDPLGLLLPLAAQVFEPARHKVVAHRERQREVAVGVTRCREGDAPLVVEVAQELSHEPVDRARGAGDRGEGERVRGAERVRDRGGVGGLGGRRGLGVGFGRLAGGG